MRHTPYKSWLAEVKEICRQQDIDFDDLADTYIFKRAWMKRLDPEEAITDATS